VVERPEPLLPRVLARPFAVHFEAGRCSDPARERAVERQVLRKTYRIRWCAGERRRNEIARINVCPRPGIESSGAEIQSLQSVWPECHDDARHRTIIVVRIVIEVITLGE